MPYSPKVWGSRAPLTGCLGLRPSKPSGEIFWREMPRLLQAKTGKRLPPSCCVAGTQDELVCTVTELVCHKAANLV